MLRVLIIGRSLSLANGVTGIFTAAIGKTAIYVGSSILSVSLTLAIAFSSASTNPVAGICIGISIGAIAGAIFTAIAFHRAVGASTIDHYVKEIIPALFAATVPCIVFVVSPDAVSDLFQSLQPARLRAFVDLLTILAIFFFSYILNAVLLGFIDKADIKDLKQVFLKNHSTK